MPDPVRVRSMFARIAKSYDLLNMVLSLGIDRRWRRALLARAGDVAGKTVVDACCGTGDVAVVFANAGARVVGVDFTPEMLTRADKKGARPRLRPAFVHGDALHLPIASGTAEACTVAFGIRNVADRRACLREMSRVVRPGGQVLVLEFTMPPGAILKALYRFYFTRVLPTIGRMVSKDGDAYSYLPRTVLAWPSPGEFQREMEEEGLVECGHSLLTRGIACIHWGRTSSDRTDARSRGAAARKPNEATSSAVTAKAATARTGTPNARASGSATAIASTAHDASRHARPSEQSTRNVGADFVGIESTSSRKARVS